MLAVVYRFSNPNPWSNRNFWEDLYNEGSSVSIPWLMCGDFNATVKRSECSRRGESLANWLKFEHWMSSGVGRFGV